jgi:type IV fimbrial biogenesis protein FimT
MPEVRLRIASRYPTVCGKPLTLKRSARFGASSRDASRGFTMTELAIAMAVVAILLAIGVPALRDLIVGQRVRTAANNLYSDLSYARAEAIKRNAQVQVIRAGDAWTSGWSVSFTGNSLRLQPSLGAVSYAGSAESSVTYNPDGRTTFAGTNSFNFSSPSASAVSMRCVVITPSGRPAVLVDRNRNGNCQDG